MEKTRFLDRFEASDWDVGLRAVCRELFTIAEWITVIAALTYVAERYASWPAKFVATGLTVVLCCYLGNLLASIAHGLGSSVLKAWHVVLISAVVAFPATLGIERLVADIVASNYEITTDSGS